ncbi:hypothetical protein NKH99_28495 [Mesorhizobium sp. M0854]|uniref:hypothetical protein n=1 Tax=Mesorhizobium sp. M0854 TaxID=2957013 RepID=UPI0033360672
MATVVDENDAFATVVRGPGVGIDLAADPPEVGMRRVPDRLELFRADMLSLAPVSWAMIAVRILCPGIADP